MQNKKRLDLILPIVAIVLAAIGFILACCWKITDSNWADGHVSISETSYEISKPGINWSFGAPFLVCLILAVGATITHCIMFVFPKLKGNKYAIIMFVFQALAVIMLIVAMSSMAFLRTIKIDASSEEPSMPSHYHMAYNAIATSAVAFALTGVWTIMSFVKNKKHVAVAKAA